VTQSVIAHRNHDTITGNIADEAGCMQPEKEGQVREAIILVGDILCSITRSIGDPAEARIQEKSAQHEEHEGKRARLMSRAGREIVGPGYSKELIRGELK
jgi:hypothetical protein